MNQAKRVLVTGASGFIGAMLRPVLAARGYEVFGTGGQATAGNLKCDIRSPQSVEQAVAQADPDIVIHCAGISSVTKGKPLDYYDVNVVGTDNLLNAVARRGKRARFIFLSTAGVYGNHPTDVLDESLCPEPVHHYGISKLAAERVALLFRDQMDLTIFRPFNIIGPGQDRSFIVPKLVNAFARRDEVIRLGNIHVYRDFLDIWTAAGIIADVIERPVSFGEVLNLCTGHGTSLMELITGLQQLTGHEPRIEQAAEFIRKNEIWRLTGSQDKLRAIVGTDALHARPIVEVLRTMLEQHHAELGNVA